MFSQRRAVGLGIVVSRRDEAFPGDLVGVRNSFKSILKAGWRNDDGQCINCGQDIRKPYTRCYRCHQWRKRANWHDPEQLSGLEKRDAQLGRSAFYVYVLDTAYGHYVGHSANVRSRIQAHEAGEVFSTAGGDPKIVWQSAPLPTRAEAARFEAALKSWRDNGKDAFKACTGFEPVSFLTPREQPSHGRGCAILLMIAGILTAVLLFVFQMFSVSS